MLRVVGNVLVNTSTAVQVHAEDCKCAYSSLKSRVGQNRIYTPYTTVYLVIFLPRVLHINRIYMVLANPAQKPIPWEMRCGVAAFFQE